MKNQTNITVIPGDGIGPEIVSSVTQIIDSLDLKLTWDYVTAGKTSLEDSGELIPQIVYHSINQNKIALKGPIETPIGKGFRSVNVSLRQQYDLYTNLRPIRSLKNDRYSNIDLIIFRENTEGLYIGLEKNIDKDTVHATKLVTRSGCKRIIKEAFDFAVKHNRKKVTLVHKANILKLADGMFLEIGRALSKEYPDIEFEDVIVDNMCMQLVLDPNQFDVIVAQNLYGDILSDLCAGLVGGLGTVPGANIGTDIAIFEAVHGTAPDIAGKNLANPTALLLSACMMLEHLEYFEASNDIRKALDKMFQEKLLTKDLGGNLSTSDFTSQMIGFIKNT
ncbi:MAG: NAD-dependent isocitrate dehydrogenase [Clostridiales bacterium]|nr:NAD-dependent isocitrate dehydrogenase [Clostridiales bacterium]